MKKYSLVCGLVPALTLGLCGTGFAQAATNPPAPAVVAVDSADVKALQELRAQLEADLESAQDMENRLIAQLESLEKRVKKVEKRAEKPHIELKGYARFRYQNHNFEDFIDPMDEKTIRINLFTKYQINKNWAIRSECEFENDLRTNKGAYEGDALGQSNWENYWRGGKKYSREMRQLYADGRIGKVGVKLGRYHLESPQKLTFDDQVDGIQLQYGIPTKWGNANISFNAGNTGNSYNYGNIMLGDTKNNYEIWASNLLEDNPDHSRTNYKLLSVMGNVPVAKNINIFTHYGKVIHRDNNNVNRSTFSIGFDTQLAKDLKFSASTAHSNADTLNRSHLLELKYKEANPSVTGSYGIYIKKYLQRLHTGLSRQFIDDIAVPYDFERRYDHESTIIDGHKVDFERLWSGQGYRVGEFNGLCIGTELVPVKNTKLKIDYTFGKFGLMDCGKGELDGRRRGYSFLSAIWDLYF